MENVLYINVPNFINDFEIVNYSRAGTWLVAKQNQLNSWKIKIPNGNYDIIGKSSENVLMIKTI